jgi:Uma2 family endonuclease
MGWLIDPDEKTVFVYLPEQKIEVYDQSEIALPVPSFANQIQLTIEEVFAWLLE